MYIKSYAKICKGEYQRSILNKLTEREMKRGTLIYLSVLGPFTFSVYKQHFEISLHHKCVFKITTHPPSVHCCERNICYRLYAVGPLVMTMQTIIVNKVMSDLNSPNIKKNDTFKRMFLTTVPGANKYPAD